MGWAKFDDRRHQNAKLQAAGLAAAGLDAHAITYCAANETDGFIAANVVSMIANCSNWKRIAIKLVQVGRWEWDQELQGWWVHDYLDYNPSKAEAQAKRSIESARQRANVSKRWAKRVTNSIPLVSESYCDLNSPDPTRIGMVGNLPPLKNAVFATKLVVDNPVDKPVADSGESDLPKVKKGSRVPEDFKITDEMRQWASSKGITFDLDAELESWIDFWRGVSGREGVKLDWVATWRNGMKSRQQRKSNVRLASSPSDRVSSLMDQLGTYGGPDART